MSPLTILRSVCLSATLLTLTPHNALTAPRLEPQGCATLKARLSEVKGERAQLSLSELNEAYERGKSAYLYGSYALAIDCLAPLLSPDLLLSSPDELALAYEYVGLAYFYLDQRAQAEPFFKSLIFFRPEHELDPVRVPPDAVTFYTQLHDALAHELQARSEALEAQRAREDAALEALTRRELIIEQRVNSRLVALLPFGVGQFQNDDVSAGYLFLTTELITTLASVGLFWRIEQMRQENGRFSRADVSFARELQSAQLITGGVALGLALSGVIHALINYQPQRPLRRFERPLTRSDATLNLDESLEEPLDDELDEDSPAAPPQPLTPLPSPDEGLDAEGFKPLSPASLPSSPSSVE
jgi:tetratricopeptide (TPR) repeat protein